MSEEISKSAYSRKWGLIFGLVSAIIFIITSAARLNLGFAGGAISWAVVIGMLVLALREFRTDNEGYMTFGQGFNIAFMVALIGGVVRAVIQYVYLMIDTEFMTWQKQIQEETAASFGAPSDQAQQVPSSMQSFMDFTQTPEFISIASVIAAIFAGLIFGAIVSAVLKNEAEEF